MLDFKLFAVSGLLRGSLEHFHKFVRGFFFFLLLFFLNYRGFSISADVIPRFFQRFNSSRLIRSVDFILPTGSKQPHQDNESPSNTQPFFCFRFHFVSPSWIISSTGTPSALAILRMLLMVGDFSPASTEWMKDWDNPASSASFFCDQPFSNRSLLITDTPSNPPITKEMFQSL